MARCAEIVREGGAIDRVVEHVRRDALEQLFVARPEVLDLDVHGRGDPSLRSG
jgi:hypothetical protein